MVAQNFAGAIEAGRAFIRFGVKDETVAGLRKVRERLRRFGASLQITGAQLFTAGAFATAPIAAALRVYTTFSDQLQLVKAVTRGTDAEFQKVSDTVKELGRTTSFTATEVGEAAVVLGRAGFSRIGITEALPDILSLARATGTELPRAADIGSAALKSFGLSTKETGRVADALVSSANNSLQTLEDLFESFKLVAPFAVEAGAGVEHMSAAIGILADNGIRGSRSGTALLRMYKNLADAKKGDGLFEDLGVSVEDLNGNLRPLQAVLNDMQKALNDEGAGSRRRLAAFHEVFGRGSAAAKKLASQSDQRSELFKTIANDAGAARRAAKTADDDIGGSFRRLKSAIEGVALAFGEALKPTIQDVAEVLRRISGTITEFISKNRELATTVAKIAVGMLVFGTLLISLGVSLQVMTFAVNGLLAPFAVLLSLAGFLVSPFKTIASIIPRTVAMLGSFGKLLVGVNVAATAGVASLIKFGSAAVGSIVGLASTLGSKILGVIGPVFTRLAAFLGAKIAFLFGSLIGSLVDLTAFLFSGLFGVVARQLASLGSILAVFAGRLALTIASSLFGVIYSALGVLTLGISSTVLPLIGLIFSAWASSVSALFAALLPAISAVGASMLAAVLPALSALAAGLGGMLASVAGVLGSIVASFLPAVLIAGTLVAILWNLPAILEVASGWARSLAGFFKSLVQPAIDGVVARVNAIMTDFSAGYETVVALVRAGRLQDAFGIALGFLKVTWYGLLADMKVAWITVTTALEDIWKGMIDIITDLLLSAELEIRKTINGLIANINSVGAVVGLSIDPIDEKNAKDTVDQFRKDALEAQNKRHDAAEAKKKKAREDEVKARKELNDLIAKGQQAVLVEKGKDALSYLKEKLQDLKDQFTPGAEDEIDLGGVGPEGGPPKLPSFAAVDAVDIRSATGFDTIAPSLNGLSTHFQKMINVAQSTKQQAQQNSTQMIGIGQGILDAAEDTPVFVLG